MQNRPTFINPKLVIGPFSLIPLKYSAAIIQFISLYFVSINIRTTVIDSDDISIDDIDSEIKDKAQKVKLMSHFKSGVAYCEKPVMPVVNKTDHL